MLVPQNPMSHIEELQRDTFHIFPGTVNARQGAGLVHTSGILQDILVTGRAHFENELAEEATWNHIVIHATCSLLLTLRWDLHLPLEIS